MWLGPLIIASAVFWVGLAYALTVTHDMGGRIKERVDQMRGMDGVRIDGDCFSACTMYLGLPDTCVTDRARLGFHSPQMRFYGLNVPMTTERWEEVTRQMGEGFPPALQEWWMREARYSTEVLVIDAGEAVRMGVQECNRV